MSDDEVDGHRSARPPVRSKTSWAEHAVKEVAEAVGAKVTLTVSR